MINQMEKSSSTSFKPSLDEILRIINEYSEVSLWEGFQKEFEYIKDKLVQSGFSLFDELEKLIEHQLKGDDLVNIQPFLDLANERNQIFDDFFPKIFKLNRMVAIINQVNSFYGTNSQKVNLIIIPKFNERLEDYKERQSQAVKLHKFDYTLGQYGQIIEKVKQIKSNLIAKLDSTFVTTQEKELLKTLPFFPKESLEYFNRGQAVSLLSKFEIGITLEKKFAEAYKDIIYSQNPPESGRSDPNAQPPIPAVESNSVAGVASQTPDSIVPPAPVALSAPTTQANPPQS